MRGGAVQALDGASGHPCRCPSCSRSPFLSRQRSLEEARAAPNCRTLSGMAPEARLPGVPDPQARQRPDRKLPRPGAAADARVHRVPGRGRETGLRAPCRQALAGRPRQAPLSGGDRLEGDGQPAAKAIQSKSRPPQPRTPRSLGRCRRSRRKRPALWRWGAAGQVGRHSRQGRHGVGRGRQGGSGPSSALRSTAVPGGARRPKRVAPTCSARACVISPGCVV